MPMRLSPPARSTSSRSSSKERPTVLPAPAVFSSSSPAAVRLGRARASPSRRRAAAPPLAARRRSSRGGRTTPSALISSPIRSAWISEVGGLLAHLPVLGGRVDQVDRVNRRGLDRPALHQLAELRDVVLLPARWSPLARRLMEDLDRVAAAFDATRMRRTIPPEVETWAPISMALVRLRTKPDRRAAHRRRAHGPLQLASGSPVGRDLVLRIEDTDRERSTPENVNRSSTRCAGSSSTGMRARFAGRAAPRAHRGDRAPARAGPPTRTRARSACVSPTRARPSSGTPSAGRSLPALGHRRLRDPPARTAARSTTWPSRWTTTTWGSPTSCAATTTSRTPPGR